MTNRKHWMFPILTGVLAVAVIIGAFTFNTVSAQTPTPTPGTPGDTSTPNADQPVPGKGLRDEMHVRGGVSDAELAAALGITEEQLQAAYETAGAEALKEAVAQGLITQAQADQMAANGLADGRHFMFRFGKPGSTTTIDTEALLAKALNISVEQLQAARQTAFNASLDAALQAGTLTQEQVDRMKGMQALVSDDAFKTGLQSAYEEQIQAAVTRGVITQAQADAILAAQADGEGLFGRGFGPGFGFDGPGRGHGGRGFRMDGLAPDGTTPDALPTLPGTQNN